MPPAKSLCQCLFKVLSSDFISFPHFYCLPRPKFLSSVFLWVLSSQTLFLIKQINIWGKGALLGHSPASLGTSQTNRAGCSWRVWEKGAISVQITFLIVWNKFSAGKCSPNLTSFGDEKCTAMTNLMTISFFLLDASIRCFSEETCEKLRSCFTEVLRSQGMCLVFSPFSFFSSGLKAEREDKPWGGRSAMKLFCTHANTHFRS